MMKVTRVRAIAAACLSHVALAEADQFPSKSVLDDPNWVKTCEDLRSYISSRPYVDLTYTGTMDLVTLGNQQVSVDGFQVGIPFLPSANKDTHHLMIAFPASRACSHHDLMGVLNVP